MDWCWYRGGQKCPNYYLVESRLKSNKTFFEAVIIEVIGGAGLCFNGLLDMDCIGFQKELRQWARK